MSTQQCPICQGSFETPAIQAGLLIPCPDCRLAGVPLPTLITCECSECGRTIQAKKTSHETTRLCLDCDFPVILSRGLKRRVISCVLAVASITYAVLFLKEITGTAANSAFGTVGISMPIHFGPGVGRPDH
jgi:hypothetical protein